MGGLWWPNRWSDQANIPNFSFIGQRYPRSQISAKSEGVGSMCQHWVFPSHLQQPQKPKVDELLSTTQQADVVAVVILLAETLCKQHFVDERHEPSYGSVGVPADGGVAAHLHPHQGHAFVSHTLPDIRGWLPMLNIFRRLCQPSFCVFTDAFCA